ncbi:MAG: hypothetical protein ACYDG6_11420 [Thermincolia bacterium]
MLEVTPEEKFFYLYLLTNPHTKQCGIYELSLKQAEFETGFNKDTILKLIDRFENTYQKIKYNPETREIALRNWGKYNVHYTSKDTMKCVERELEAVRAKDLIKYVYPLQGPYRPPRKEKENKNKKEKENKNGYTDEFEKFWSLYPRKVEKKSAFKNWYSRIGQDIKPDEMILAAKNYATNCLDNKTESRFIKHPATFIGPSEPFKDWINKLPPDGGEPAPDDTDDDPEFQEWMKQVTQNANTT